MGSDASKLYVEKARGMGVEGIVVAH